MSKELESYKIGNINVSIEETESPEKVNVLCRDDAFRMEFTARMYEYKYYKRHMNQKIKKRFEEAHQQEDS